jgi:uncharacterized damage-inducible protein DinB
VTPAIDADLAAARAATLRLVAPLTQPELDFAPRSGSWSIGEVLDHLLRAEGLYRSEIRRLIDLKLAGRRPYIRRTFADLNVAPAFVPRAVLPWLEMPFTMMNAFVPDIVRDAMTEFPLMAIRNPDIATPQAGRRGDELKSALARSIDELRALIAAHPSLNFSEMVSDHPMTGASTVPQILRFLTLHERRHQGQISRVMGDSRFPRR